MTSLLLYRRSPSLLSHPSTISPPRRIHTVKAPSDEQTLRLPDGRTLAFAEYGAPDGHPLLFFHGFPSSRLEASAIHKLATRRDIRVICPDRPGFGLSSPQPNRRIVDWPADTQALVDHLGLSRFSILGGSGGGPYALACAYRLPHEMMSSVGILAGAPPWEAGVKDLPWTSRAIAYAANAWPTPLTWLTGSLVASLRWSLSTRPATRWLDRILASDGPDTIEDARNKFLRMAFEGFAQGAEATVHEARLLTGDWGFRFEDVTYDEILLWHATRDWQAPIGMVRYMAERLPHSRLREFEGETHFTIASHLEQIVSDLIPQK